MKLLRMVRPAVGQNLPVADGRFVDGRSCDRCQAVA